MPRLHRLTIRVMPYQQIMLPKGSRILDVQLHYGQPSLLIEIEDGAARPVHISMFKVCDEVVGVGYRYIGCFILDGGFDTFLVYEVDKEDVSHDLHGMPNVPQAG